MEFAEAVAKLRARMLDAVKLEMGKENPAEFTLTALLQVMNEAERNRQECVKQCQHHREAAKAAEYQASAYSQIHSVVWAVYNGLVVQEEKALREQQEREAEKKKEAEENGKSEHLES